MRAPRPARPCAAHKPNGDPCPNYAIHGGTVCDAHGGRADQVKRKAAVRAEVMSWGLDDTHEDPSEVLLRLVTQSAARVRRYSMLLKQAFDAAEALRAAYEHGDLVIAPPDTDDEEDEPVAVRQARENLDRVFNTGGVAALIGYKFTASNNGSIYAAEEHIRGLAALEGEERDRCANFAAKAIAAGLATKQVELAQQMGRKIADVLALILDDPSLALTDEQRSRVPDVGERVLSLVG